MQNNTAALVFAILITAALFGGTYYAGVIRPAKPVAGEKATSAAVPPKNSNPTNKGTPTPLNNPASQTPQYPQHPSSGTLQYTQYPSSGTSQYTQHPSSRPPQHPQYPSSGTSQYTQHLSSRTPQHPQYPSSRTPRSGDPGSTRPKPQPAAPRTRTILRCHDPEMGEYYTNAATCEGADLANRMSYAQPVPINPGQAQYGNAAYQSPQNQAGNSRSNRQLAQSKPPEKPNLRLTGKPPPPGLPAECKFPVGKALEIERDLAAADVPYESTWRKSYCRFRREAIEDGCPVSDQDFYYPMRQMCR
ncbi:hypothetical protein V3330_13440 [Wenzhouxiangellaceae bacterium CH-27]|uniref:Uncharacterized protein n=2 Tax=Elongatibacter sediminis TaxID=3119006 RepID=A0AAW9RAD1_9GAMM